MLTVYRRSFFLCWILSERSVALHDVSRAQIPAVVFCAVLLSTAARTESLCNVTFLRQLCERQ